MVGIPPARRYVYDFEEADPANKRLFGGKGASLALMTSLGLPVPPGFIITTEACEDFYRPRKADVDSLVTQLERNPPPEVRDRLVEEVWRLIDGLRMPEGLMEEVLDALRRLEKKVGRRFGDPDAPLLVSVRSGAPVSMPGMLDTVLNLGLNDETVVGLANMTNDWRFAYDSYRRFLQMFGKIVLGVDERLFNEELERVKARYGVRQDVELPVEGLKELVERYKEVIAREKGFFPQDPHQQLELAIRAVFRSWMNPRAIFYRTLNKITSEVASCTAVNVQAMVFGNMGFDSGTGVVFSRNPATGENELYGEFLPNAQGEDVVAGVRTPMRISELRERFPRLYEELYEKVKLLERHEREVQDVEFTVERGRLYFLQTRAAKMTPLARVRTAVEMALEGLITKEEAVMVVRPGDVLQLLYPTISPGVKASPVARGLPASPGAVSGRVVFDPDRAVEMARVGERVILVRVETKPDDIHGFYAAVGILTSRGGMTSHAAVVARAMGKPAVVGAEAIRISYEERLFRVDGREVREGDYVTIDGSTGCVYLGQLPTEMPKATAELETLLSWADSFRALGVRANADLAEDAAIARRNGAEGIGLLRIERMFRKPERLELLRRVILSERAEEREAWMNELARLVKEDFKEVLRVMDGLPVIIRLIDPPLHEFLPRPDEVLKELYELRLTRAPREVVEERERLYRRIVSLTEANPMMGHRGVRVGVTYPEIYRGLCRAIFEAMAELILEGRRPVVGVMVPQVALAEELRFVKERAIIPVAREVEMKYGVRLEFKVGTMMETVRACLVADEIAKEADFLSFGTNDLTQATFSFSRDDAENKFLPAYLELKLLEHNPFDTIDERGVGELVRLAVRKARSVKPEIEIGVCGEHGGDPRSISFFLEAGLDYVSASPFRIPVARLAAAQASIARRRSSG